LPGRAGRERPNLAGCVTVEATGRFAFAALSSWQGDIDILPEMTYAYEVPGNHTCLGPERAKRDRNPRSLSPLS